jgi:hypothetical protein
MAMAFWQGGRSLLGYILSLRPNVKFVALLELLALKIVQKT